VSCFQCHGQPCANQELQPEMKPFLVKKTPSGKKLAPDRVIFRIKTFNINRLVGPARFELAANPL